MEPVYLLETDVNGIKILIPYNKKDIEDKHKEYDKPISPLVKEFLNVYLPPADT